MGRHSVQGRSKWFSTSLIKILTGSLIMFKWTKFIIIFQLLNSTTILCKRMKPHTCLHLSVVISSWIVMTLWIALIGTKSTPKVIKHAINKYNLGNLGAVTCTAKSLQWLPWCDKGLIPQRFAGFWINVYSIH